MVSEEKHFSLFFFFLFYWRTPLAKQFLSSCCLSSTFGRFCPLKIKLRLVACSCSGSRNQYVAIGAGFVACCNLSTGQNTVIPSLCPHPNTVCCPFQRRQSPRTGQTSAGSQPAFSSGVSDPRNVGKPVIFQLSHCV